MTPMMPSVVGARSEMAVASALQQAGMDVFVPLFAAHSRADLVAGGEAGLVSVQCKTARISGGALYFHTCSHTGNVPSDYRGQVDAFGVYAPELHLVYLVPVADAPLRGCTLRLEPAMNGQRSRIRWAEHYLVGPP